MTGVIERTVVTEPGVYDLDEASYHGDPVVGGSLSHSGARRLLAPSCPAKFDHERRNGRAEKPEFDFGKAAHHEVLGAGADLCVIDAPDWRTKAAREQRDEAYAEGRTPLLVDEYEVVRRMAAALRAHPFASALFDAEIGRPERSLFGRDEQTGVMLRARFDYLDNDADQPDGGRLLIPDYKTARSADTASVERALHEYGYASGGAWYGDLAKRLGLCERYAFLLVVQEKAAPFLVNVVDVSQMALTIGRYRNRQAVDLYARCVEAGRWPGYEGFDQTIPNVSLPAWVERAYFEEIQ
jgi:hypothetical protein